MRRRSLRHTVEDEAYRLLRDALLPGRCEVCPRWRRVGVETGCNGTGGELHHRRKRSSAGALAHRENVLVSCNRGNLLVEDEPELAYKAGLVLRPEDGAEWEAMSARLWRKQHESYADGVDGGSKIVQRVEARL